MIVVDPPRRAARDEQRDYQYNDEKAFRDDDKVTMDIKICGYCESIMHNIIKCFFQLADYIFIPLQKCLKNNKSWYYVQHNYYC